MGLSHLQEPAATLNSLRFIHQDSTVFAAGQTLSFWCLTCVFNLHMCVLKNPQIPWSSNLSYTYQECNRSLLDLDKLIVSQLIKNLRVWNKQASVFFGLFIYVGYHACSEKGVLVPNMLQELSPDTFLPFIISNKFYWFILFNICISPKPTQIHKSIISFLCILLRIWNKIKHAFSQ